MRLRMGPRRCVTGREVQADSFHAGDANGAASCRFATRPVLRTRPGHPTMLTFAYPQDLRFSRRCPPAGLGLKCRFVKTVFENELHYKCQCLEKLTPVCGTPSGMK